MEKSKVDYVKNLEKYRDIIDYYEVNPNEISRDMRYLQKVHAQLRAPFGEKVDVSDSDIQEKIRMICAYREGIELGSKLSGIIMQDLAKRLATPSEYKACKVNWLEGETPENKFIGAELN